LLSLIRNIRIPMVHSVGFSGTNPSVTPAAIGPNYETRLYPCILASSA
jgi:hypothetical protein